MDASRLELTRNFVMLCGYFSYDPRLQESAGRERLLASYRPWYERQDAEARKRYYGYLAGYYYPNFLKVAFPECGDVLEGREGPGPGAPLLHLTLRDALPVRASIAVSGRPARAVAFDWADLYLYPEGIGVFAVKTRLLAEADAGGKPDMAALSDYLYLLRSDAAELDAGGWKGTVAAFIQGRVMKAPTAGSPWLLFGGGGADASASHAFHSKLKTLIAAETDLDVSTEEGGELEENLLFELGTGSRLGTIRENGHFAPSRDYYRRIVETGKISVFNNWSCLSLFDTFTVLLNKPQSSSFSTLDNFENIYLSLYVHAVFLKLALYRLNTQIAELSPSDKRNKAARDRFLGIKNLFFMSHVSNNFLPNEMHRRLSESLEIESEIGQLEEKIEKINDGIEERSAQVMNRFLAFMAFVAPFSAMWDFTEWSNKIFGLDRSYPVFSLLVFVALFLVPLAAILSMSARRRRRRGRG